MDVSALIDAVDAGQLLSEFNVDTDAVAVVGHSWGATSALQLVGCKPPVETLLSVARTPTIRPQPQLVVAVSWLDGADQGSLADLGVRTAVLVSPPLRLLFDASSGPAMHAKVLLVSGTRDWVVPSDPEAVVPLRNGQPMANGHRIVVASGGDASIFGLSDADEAPVLAH